MSDDDLQFYGTVHHPVTQETWHYQVIALPLGDAFSWDGVARCGERELLVEQRTIISDAAPSRAELERWVAQRVQIVVNEAPAA